MARASLASRRHVDLTRIGFDVGNEFRKGLRWKGWMHNHDVGHDHNAGDRREVADEIETWSTVSSFTFRFTDRCATTRRVLDRLVLRFCPIMTAPPTDMRPVSRQSRQ